MLYDSSSIWFFVLCIIYPELGKVSPYAYDNDFCIRNKTKEKVTDYVILGVDKVKRSAPRYMYDIFQNSLDKSKAASRNFTFQDLKTIEESDIIVTYAVLNRSDANNIWFDVSITPSIDYIIAAELHLFLKNSRNNLKVLVYRVMSERRGERHFEFIDSVIVNANYKGWIKLKITETMEFWLNQPRNDFGLHLSIAYVEENIYENGNTIVLEFGNEQADKQPFLVGYFASSKAINDRLIANSRWKRSEPYVTTNYLDNPYVLKDTTRRRGNSGSCRLQKLYVRFRDFDFDKYIVAPEGFDAQYCIGECRFPLNAHMNATNHAIVQTLVHFLMPGRAPKACCVPRELAHLSVLYSRDGINHMLKKYRNMIIKSCGCH